MESIKKVSPSGRSDVATYWKRQSQTQRDSRRLAKTLFASRTFLVSILGSKAVFPAIEALQTAAETACKPAKLDLAQAAPDSSLARTQYSIFTEAPLHIGKAANYRQVDFMSNWPLCPFG